MNKKKLLKIIAIVLAVVLVCGASFGGYILYRTKIYYPKGLAHNYGDIFNYQKITYDVGEDGKFLVLKINDTHFLNGTCENDRKTMSDLEIILDATPCDFIVVNGDMVDGFNLNPNYDKYGATKIFADLVDSYNIPWTFVPGNNDGEIDGDNEFLIAFLMQYKNFVCGNDPEVSGNMHFFVDLEYNGKLAHSLAFMDSNARTIKAVGEYDYIKENQINWLLNGINERKVKTSVFFHMNTPAFKTAFENGEAYEGFPSAYVYELDNIKENKLFDDMTADNEYISLISIGHVHSNNMCHFYNGRYYQLSSVSGYNASHPEDMIPSCTLTVIDVKETNPQEMYEFEKRTVIPYLAAG